MNVLYVHIPAITPVTHTHNKEERQLLTLRDSKGPIAKQEHFSADSEASRSNVCATGIVCACEGIF